MTSRPAARASEPSARRGRPLDWLLALGGHVIVGASWLVLVAALMGSLDVARRMVMNSEFAWDTGRLPQPWVIPLAAVAVWLSHRFFLWAMRRAGGGRQPWDARVVAWLGALAGVLLGVYLGTPPLQVGVRVGPSAGMSAPWGLLAWAAYHAKTALPVLVGLMTAALLVLSPQSPLVVTVRSFLRWHRARGRSPLLRRRRAEAPGGSTAA